MGTKKNQNIYPGDRILEELGLDPKEWGIGAGYNKWFLTGSRYAQVTAHHIPTGREKTATFYGAGKAARREAVAVARRLVQELGQG